MVGYISQRELRAKMGELLHSIPTLTPRLSSLPLQDFLVQRNKTLDANTPCFFYNRNSEGADREEGLDFYELVYNVRRDLMIHPLSNRCYHFLSLTGSL